MMVINSRKYYLGLLMAVLVMASCKEETRVNIVEGFVYADCNTPLSSTEVAFKANAGGAFNEPLILASDITDPNGYFRFTYELEETKTGTADLITVKPVGFETALRNIPINKDQQIQTTVIDQSSVIMTITGGKIFQPTDTFYYGIQFGTQAYKVQPYQGFSDTLYTRVENVENPARWTAFGFGFGLRDYQISVESLSIQDSSYNHVWVEVTGCGDTEIIDLPFE